MGTYRELNAWKEARILCNMVYRITEALPKSERYGLSSQMRRAAVSILSNIAEGYGRDGAKEYVHFLRISCGSAYELETQIILCSDLHYIEKMQADELHQKNVTVLKLLRGLIRSLQTQQATELREETTTYAAEDNECYSMQPRQPTTNN